MQQQVAAFLDSLRHERRASPNTVRAYKHDLGSFVLFCQGRLGRDPAVEDLDIPMVRSFLATLFGHNAASTIARKLSALRSLGDFLVRRDIRQDNPVKLVAMAENMDPKMVKEAQTQAENEAAAIKADTLSPAKGKVTAKLSVTPLP